MQLLLLLLLLPPAIPFLLAPAPPLLSLPRSRGPSRGPSVRRAFAVLYQDLAPLRLAGDMLFRHLRRAAERAGSEGEEVRREVGGRVGREIEEEDVTVGKRIFDLIDRNGDRRIERAELEARADDLRALFPAGVDPASLLSGAEPGAGDLGFEEFLVALIGALDAGGEEGGTATLADLREACAGLEEEDGCRDEEAEGCKREARFAFMIGEVRRWEKAGVRASGRVGEILEGTYEGAKDPEIVAALRAVYTGYSAFGFAGDLIFKLLKSVMGRKQRRLEREPPEGGGGGGAQELPGGVGRGGAQQPVVKEFDGYALRDAIVGKWGVPFDVMFRPVTSLGNTGIYCNVMPVAFGTRKCQHRTEQEYLQHLQAVVEILDEYNNLTGFLENLAGTDKTPRGNTSPLVAVTYRMKLNDEQVKKIAGG
ncbi:hypothetical protein TeGR_g2451 [Tetraparma gracilis]|uniref:EF-hand domain-containing protein n=1 Tax=Tetraparma gracilis TaxID=2962635 RepID=A0ABQ6N991_9STRA|nr:hypothetical protein TeGR_g2451 [Tetraparma gracilis]